MLRRNEMRGSRTMLPVGANEREMISPIVNDVAPVQILRETGTVRNIALKCAVALVFIRFSLIHQLLSYQYGTNFRLLYLFAIPALLGFLVTGGLEQSVRHRPVRYWLLFGMWMVLATPFSIWKGDSAQYMWNYFKAELLLLFVICGLVRSWAECRLVMYAIAAAATVNLVSARLFSSMNVNDRLGLDFSTVGNANDFAAHLLIVLPFLLWIALEAKSWSLRIFSFLGVGYGVFVILASASRGGAIALTVDMIFLLLVARGRRRFFVVLLGSLLLLVAINFVPEAAIQRILSLSSPNAPQEAEQSAEVRKQVFWDSIHCALEHPVLGIGPGQFITYEGQTKSIWKAAHNSYTQAAAEGGIPALIFYLAGILSSMRLLKAVSQKVRSRPELADIKSAVLCIGLAMVGFCTATFFLNFTYFFYLPAISGLTVAVASATRLSLGQELTKVGERILPLYVTAQSKQSFHA